MSEAVDECRLSSKCLSYEEFIQEDVQPCSHKPPFSKAPLENERKYIKRGKW